MSKHIWLPVTPTPSFRDGMNNGDWKQAADYVRAIECELKLLRRFLAYADWRKGTLPKDMRNAVDSCKLGQEWEGLC